MEKQIVLLLIGQLLATTVGIFVWMVKDIFTKIGKILIVQAELEKDMNAAHEAIRALKGEKRD